MALPRSNLELPWTSTTFPPLDRSVGQQFKHPASHKENISMLRMAANAVGDLTHNPSGASSPVGSPGTPPGRITLLRSSGCTSSVRTTRWQGCLASDDSSLRLVPV